MTGPPEPRAAHDRLPDPTDPAGSTAELFLAYIDFYRARVLAKWGSLPGPERRSSRPASGWSPAELLVHLRHLGQLDVVVETITGGTGE